ncbi:MAG: hypothetical protein WD875_05010 [Pirellulales bacterium]
MAGPWFAVQSSGEWREVDRIWISNGQHSQTARAEIRVELEEPNHDTFSLISARP